jgi:tetratricopeptide (TPR) repeat protein
LEVLETTRQKKTRRELLEGYLRQADTARDRGDLETAQAVLAKAIEVDGEDSRVRVAHVALARLIEEAARQTKARTLLENARQEIGARHFTAAMELLQEAERVDPAHPELISLQAAAKSGRDQEQRRRILDQIQNEVALAATPEELARAVQLVDKALDRMPSDPTLLKIKGQLSRQMREAETRRRIDTVSQRCRELLDTAPEEALKLVRDALHDAPGNDRLLALQSTIAAQVSEQKNEESRAQYLTRAHEALSSGRYDEAFRILETCQKEGIFSQEVAELMDFARQEAEQHSKDTKLQDLLRRAQELMSRGDYRAVVELLTPLSGDPGSASLLFLLEDARSRVQVQQRDLDAALNRAEVLAGAEQYSEAVQLLESQSTSVLQAEPVQNLLKRMREASENEVKSLQAVGRAYAALERLDVGVDILQQPGGNAETPLMARIVPVFTSRRKSLADRQLSFAMEQARGAIEGGDKKRAAETLKTVATFSEYASGTLKTEWQALVKKAEKGKILGRLGRK